MRNPPAELYHCFKFWRVLRAYPGLFSLRDAALSLSEIALPKRISYWIAGKALAKEARIDCVELGVYRVTVLPQNISFLWPGKTDNNLHYTIDQEFNSQSAHCYTTPPIQLSPRAVVLDVGACEGLFALRLLKTNSAAQVISFEPSEVTANLLQRAAKDNNVADRLTIEKLAVGRTSGIVQLVEGDSPTGNRVTATASGSDQRRSVACVSLDDYCSTHMLKLNEHDLIKVDAEGWDFDVLQGAREIIRAGRPQIAVTTYHEDSHVFDIVNWIQGIEPRYRMRLKGFSSWTQRPRPVLLQASMLG